MTTRTVPIAEVTSESLRGLPGYALRCAAEVWLDRAALARVIDAALADMHAEWVQARAAGRTSWARWIAVRGNAALLLSLSACAFGALRAEFPRLTSIGIGALLFPLLLFAVLAEAIRPEASGPRPPKPPIVEWWMKPLAPVIVTPSRVPPPKPELESAKELRIPGPGPVLPPAKAPPGTIGREVFSGPLLPRAPELPLSSVRRESDALPRVRIPPEYPPALIQRGIEGFVVVRLWIGTRGEVTRAEIVQAHPRRAFERAALEAVRRWRYQPAERDGAAVVRGPIEVLLDFKLENTKR